jgi:hypothetical protein
MKKKKVLMYEIECNKCGKKAEVDNEKSNNNWTAYKTGKCECGGIIMPNIDKPYYIYVAMQR